MENALVFAWAAHVLGLEARRLGLVCPGFRSPPKRPGIDRSLRRRRAGAAPVIAVRLGGRCAEAVVADMVQGVVVVNGCTGSDAERRRHQLRAALGSLSVPTFPGP